MARYTLPKAQSMYRDTGLVHNTTLFRQRYVENMAANDALAQAVLEMQSLAQDDETKRALIEEYNSRIKFRSEGGNLHMQGAAIQKDARAFMNDYNPIKTSKERYDAYAAAIEKDYQGGNINSNTRDLRLKQALYNYKGIQYHNDGSVDEESLFSGVNYVKDVNVTDRIDDKIKGKILTEIDDTGMEYAFNENMEMMTGTEINPTTGLPAFYVKQGEYTKYLDPKVIESVVNSVLAEPDVDASIKQQAELEHFYKGDIAQGSNLSIAQDQVNKVLNSMDSQIEKLESKKKRTKEEDNTLESLIAQEESLLKAQNEGVNPIEILTSLSYNMLRQTYSDAAHDQYGGIKSKKVVREIQESNRFTQSLKDRNNLGIAYRVGVEGLQYETTGGSDIASKTVYNANLTHTNNAFKAKYGENFFNAAAKAASNEDHVNLSDAYFQETGISLAPEVIAGIAKNIQQNLRDIKNIEQTISDAYSLIGTTEEEYNMNMSNKYDDYIGHSQGRKSEDRSAEPNNITMTLITDVMGDLGKTGTSHELLIALNDNEELQKRVISEIVKRQRPQLSTVLGGKGDAEASLRESYSTLLEQHAKDIKTDHEIMDAGLTKDGAIDALVLPSFADPSGGTTKTVRSIFEDGFPGSNSDDFSLIDPETGHKTSYGKLKENNPELFAHDDDGHNGIVLKKMGIVHISGANGEKLLAIPIKLKDGKTKTYFADASQIAGENGGPLNRYLNSDEYKVRSFYSNGRTYSIPTETPDIFEGSVIFNYATEEIAIDNPALPLLDGEPQKTIYSTEIGLQKLTKFVKDHQINL